MNYEKKYNEALGWMREMYPCLTDSLREDAEHFFPELAESEDERIRKALVKLLTVASEAYLIHSTGIKKESYLAWLEKQKEPENKSASTMAPSCWEVKQKEQKHNYCLYGGYPNVGRCRWCSAACSARLADVHTDEEKEYIRTIKSIISDFIRDKKPENLAYYQRIYDWLDGRHVPFSCGHENGQPADEDGHFDEDEFLEDELSAFLQNYDKEYDDDAAVSDVARHFYEIGKKQNEQKSVPFSCGHENGQSTEWAELQSEFKNINEAFEDGKKEVIDHPDKYGLTKQKTPDPVFSKQEYESYPIISKDTISAKPAELDGKALLHTADKSYQIGFRDGVASVKSEWSEEDEHRRDGIIQWLREYQEKFNPKYDSLSIESIESLIDWLKSIRPSWKPSEQEKGALRTAIHVLTEERNFPKAASQLQNILDAFNGKESRKDWKPSEEQLPGIEEHGIPGKDFIPVEWVDACEKYGKWKIVQQEQPEVELEKEIIRYQREDMDRDTTVGDVARHFYGLCNHTLEEAARHVYKSWMGGTMDDVRRDMVELGKALNARGRK